MYEIAGVLWLVLNLFLSAWIAFDTHECWTDDKPHMRQSLEMALLIVGTAFSWSLWCIVYDMLYLLD